MPLACRNLINRCISDLYHFLREATVCIPLTVLNFVTKFCELRPVSPFFLNLCISQSEVAMVLPPPYIDAFAFDQCIHEAIVSH